MLKQHLQPKGYHTYSISLSAVQTTYGTVDTAKLLYTAICTAKITARCAIHLQRRLGKCFYYGRSLTLAYVGQTRWQRPGGTVSEHRRKVSTCQAQRPRPEKTSQVKS